MMATENIIPFGLKDIPSQRGLKIEDAAKYIGMHPQTLRKLTDLGQVPCRRIGNHRVFLLEELDRWLESAPAWVAHGNS